MNHQSFSKFFQRERATDSELTGRGRKQTKVIATMGPACEDPEVLRQMFHAGMNVARFNMSHGDHETHLQRLHTVRSLSQELERPIGVLVDLQGPKIRLGRFRDGRVAWEQGERVVLTTADEPEGDRERVETTYRDLHVDVTLRSQILIDDGRIRLEVVAIENRDITCEVVVGGEVSSNKGINLPGVNVSAPALTEKDKDDLAWAVNQDVDYIALSFVRAVQDVRNLRRRINEAGRDIPIIAKIERPEAVEHMEDLIASADGIMVARGDLGIEISSERLPALQKHLIARSNAHGKLVITATQMLESMVNSPIPTRAESSDVANAVFDGTDAIMLSGETAAGSYPVEAVKEMMQIAVEAEESPYLRNRGIERDLCSYSPVALALAATANQLAQSIDAKAVMLFGSDEHMPLLLSKQRSQGKTISLCHDERTWRRLSLYWGMVPLRITYHENPADLLEAGITEAIRHGAIATGDQIVALMTFAGDTDSTIRIVEV